jgi:hypothetical protein
MSFAATVLVSGMQRLLSVEASRRNHGLGHIAVIQMPETSPPTTGSRVQERLPVHRERSTSRLTAHLRRHLARPTHCGTTGRPIRLQEAVVQPPVLGKRAGKCGRAPAPPTVAGAPATNSPDAIVPAYLLLQYHLSNLQGNDFAAKSPGRHRPTSTCCATWSSASQRRVW